ncbi:MAG: hypothetical protein LBQ54_02060 [Planctomycetaceae bacterium]|nr:hypothetical protein [Planctomycetaceae bacterium]
MPLATNARALDPEWDCRPESHKPAPDGRWNPRAEQREADNRKPKAIARRGFPAVAHRYPSAEQREKDDNERRTRSREASAEPRATLPAAVRPRRHRDYYRSHLFAAPGEPLVSSETWPAVF